MFFYCLAVHVTVLNCLAHCGLSGEGLGTEANEGNKEYTNPMDVGACKKIVEATLVTLVCSCQKMCLNQF